MKIGAIQEMMDETQEMQIAPLIDCVFQLLIYFMVAARLQAAEADLSMALPGAVVQGQTIQMPDEQIIEVSGAGKIVLNNREYGKGGVRELPDLEHLLIRYRLAAETAKGKALITIQASDDTPHQRVIDIMNACAGAGIKNVSFSMGGD